MINYLLAVPIGGEINEATATLRMIDIGEGGTIDDIPTYKYFKNSKWNAIYPVPNYKGELVYDNMSM